MVLLKLRGPFCVPVSGNLLNLKTLAQFSVQERKTCHRFYQPSMVSEDLDGSGAARDSLGSFWERKRCWPTDLWINSLSGIFRFEFQKNHTYQKLRRSIRIVAPVLAYIIESEILLPNRDAMKLYQELQEVLSARNILVALQSALIYEQISKHKRAAGALKKSAFWGTWSILGQVGGRGPGVGRGGVSEI